MKPLALVVENDAGTRKLLEVLLARLEFDVDLVPTESDALLLLREITYDLVVTDGAMLLPSLDDEQLARTIVIVQAGEAQLLHLQEQWPRARVLSKPFDLVEMIEAAQSLITGRTNRTLTLAETFCRSSVRAGAKAGVIVRRHGTEILPVHSFGYEPGVFESYFPMDLQAHFPICAAMRHARPVWIASLLNSAPDYPLLAPVWAKYESRALATVPLLRSGITIGAVGWSFREPRLFAENEQAVFLAIAEAAAMWIGNGNEQSAAGAGA